jgi:Ca2+/Na+ antiporter
MKIKVLLFLFCFAIFGCKIIKSNKNKKSTTFETNENELINSTNETDQSVVNSLSESDIKELRHFISNMNIEYNGESLEDKLDISLKKTEAGTNISISGKGKATYNEFKDSQISTFKKDLYSRQDSLFNSVLSIIKSQQKELKTSEKTKEKQSTKKGFTVGIYMMLTICISFAIFLYWIGRKIKLTFFTSGFK